MHFCKYTLLIFPKQPIRLRKIYQLNRDLWKVAERQTVYPSKSFRDLQLLKSDSLQFSLPQI